MKYLLMVTFSLFVLGCKNQSAESSAQSDVDEVLSNELPEDFLGFYMRFHSDSLYQLDHIVFPLKMKGDSSAWLAEEWKMHKPFNDHSGEYVQNFVNMNGLIFEYIQDKRQIFKMERRFIKADEGYDLIYYKVDNILNDSQDWEPSE